MTTAMRQHDMNPYEWVRLPNADGWEPIVHRDGRWWSIRQRADQRWTTRPGYPGVSYATRGQAMRDCYGFASP